METWFSDELERVLHRHMTADDADDKRDKQQVFLNLVIFVWNYLGELFRDW